MVKEKYNSDQIYLNPKYLWEFETLTDDYISSNLLEASGAAVFFLSFLFLHWLLRKNVTFITNLSWYKKDTKSVTDKTIKCFLRTIKKKGMSSASKTTDLLMLKVAFLKEVTDYTL